MSPISAPCQRKCSSARPSSGTSESSSSTIGVLLEEALDLFALLVGHVSAEGGEHERLARTCKCLGDEVAEQVGLQRVLGVRGGVHVRALALVPGQQALAVHHLHQ